MPERATISQGIQLGVESTRGTAVAANKKLSSLSISPGIQSEFNTFRPMGNKWPTVVAQNREWVQAGLEGAPTFDEIIYPLSSVLDVATVTQPDATNAPNAHLWTFQPATSDTDDPKTFTIEQGDSTRAHRFAYGLVTELGLNFSRGGLELSGSMIGQRLEDGVTLTASPTTLPIVPILPTHVSVYVDATAAALGTTKLTRDFAADWTVGDRFNPVWPLDAAEDSFAAHVEAEPSGSLAIRPQADAVGMGFLDNARAGDTRFIRIEAVGDVIGGAISYRLRLDLAGKINEIGEFDDEDGVFVSPYTFQVVHDGTWGKSMQVEVVNTQSTL